MLHNIMLFMCYYTEVWNFYITAINFKTWFTSAMIEKLCTEPVCSDDDEAHLLGIS